MNPLLPFLMAGDPTLEDLPKHLSQARALGLETMELGLPHSDPIADGPVLQAAAYRAVQRGTTPRRVLEALAGIKDSPDLVLFTYFNPLFQLGVEELLRLLRPTPVKALLVVDLPDDQEPDFENALRAEGYPTVPLLTPTTDLTRAAKLLTARPDPGPGSPFAQRFAYVVARLGVTGGGILDMAPIARRVAELRALTDRPLAVGFGLSDATSLNAVRNMGATPVIGSALVEELSHGLELGAALKSRL